MGSVDPAPLPERHRVVVAGAGVAGLEALLALSDLAPDRVAPMLVAPGDEFVYKPLLVTVQFGGTGALRVGLEEIVADAGASRLREALVSVDPGARTVRTSSGTELGYDALLIALGARPVPAVPGALTFADADGAAALGKLLERLGRRNSKRLAFVIPPGATWSLAAYELALMTAAERSARRLSGVEVSLITHETAPLELFGEQVAARIAARLAEAGVELRLGCDATRFAERRIELASGAAIEADDAVALPKLVAEPIPGLPQTRDGFVRTDAQMRVAGLEQVWAAGDITAFPVKQGGLAAQQAVVAARAIASRAGAHVPIEPWSPVLRAALITGGPVEYLRAPIHDRDRSEASAGEALWSPPAKIAGRYLGAYLAPTFGAARSPKLVDLEPRSRASTEPRTPTRLARGAARGRRHLCAARRPRRGARLARARREARLRDPARVPRPAPAMVARARSRGAKRPRGGARRPGARRRRGGDQRPAAAARRRSGSWNAARAARWPRS